jgi:dolichyl-phosphate beta-glucosyltransferase
VCCCWYILDADGASRIEDLEELWESMDAIAPNKAPGMTIGSGVHLVETEAAVKVNNILVHLIYGLTVP